ncbi:hypothetical protein MYX06_00555 [Patescibacteria group bacterium AH-259-L05]|nr:hypothetical protein [Patescibacteria group bacterium AH-259-L05]
MERIAKPYKLLFEELSKEKYQTYSVYEYFIKRNAQPKKNKVNVIVRIDVDEELDLCSKLSTHLKQKNIHGSFYFLTHPERYYNTWNSPIPKLVSSRGFEVGLHTDHYYEELALGENALKNIKKDVRRLSALIGKDIKGMVYHGHPAMDALGKINGDIYKDVPPKELGLLYHDFTIGMGPQQDKRFNYYHILDHLVVADGWRYFPSYPVRKLRRIKQGETAIIFMHPTSENKLIFSLRDLSFKDLKYFLKIRLRHQLVDPLIKGNSARLYFYNLLPGVLKKLFKK